MLLAALLLVVAGSGWFLKQQSAEPAGATRDGSSYDSFVRNMNLRAMDKDGNLKYHVRADLMTHLPDAKRYDLDQPRVRFLHTDGSEWHVRSTKGQTTASGDRVWLLGQVDINRPATEAAAAMRIETSDLLVQPDSETAETQAAARITSKNHRVDSVGLRADFRNKTLELHSQVRSRIDVNG
jgi:LPS export ABC transporter protein LptC